MKLKFLGQGFESESIDSVGNHLIKYLSDTDYHTFTAFSAFTSVAAIRGVKKLIKNAPKNYHSFTFILGINQRGTSKEALEEVKNLDVSSYIFYHSSKFIFHPKIYLFEGPKISKVIIGSSNLTNSGLFTNIESSILVSLNLKEKADLAFIDELKNYYKGIFDKSDPNLKPITNDLIEKLVVDGIVPLEEQRKAEFRKYKDKVKIRESSNFPIRKLPEVPTLFRKIVTQSNIRQNISNRNNYKTYLYTEPSYHFPQGVHMGHILYALKTIKDKALLGSHLDNKHIRLRGGFDTGNLGGFQRKAKYLLVALMEMGLVNDNRILTDQTKFRIELTEIGRELTKILTPLLDVEKLDFKQKLNSVPSWEMVSNKTHYVGRLKILINSIEENISFWRDLINFPAVRIMLQLLKSAKESEISKTKFIYNNYFSFQPTLSFCKALDIKPGTMENAKHRCPFLLDLLEIGGIIEQKRSFVKLI